MKIQFILTIIILMTGCDLFDPRSENTKIESDLQENVIDSLREQNIVLNLSIVNQVGIDTLHFGVSEPVTVVYTIENLTGDSLIYWRLEWEPYYNFLLIHCPDPNIDWDYIGGLEYYPFGFTELMPPDEMWSFDTTFTSHDTGRYQLQILSTFDRDPTIMNYNYESNYQDLSKIFLFFE